MLDMGTPDTAEHDRLVASIGSCTCCRLCLQRTHVVVFRGAIPAPLMLIGEAPGETEDRTGLPFVGPSGTLLERLMVRADVPPEQVYICNAVKCRPPLNRNPSPDELRSCRPFLLQQIDLVKPRVLVTVGKVATSAVTETFGSMGVLLAEDLVCRHTGLPVIPIYHPAYLLRRLDDPAAKTVFQETVARLRKAWALAHAS